LSDEQLGYWFGGLAPLRSLHTVQGGSFQVPRLTYFHINEISSDERFAPELFSRPYTEDHQVDHADRFPREISLDEAHALAPFPLLMPKFV
jgi:hypothetical protein